MTLPDPQLHPELYRDLVLKRFLAWVVDALVIVALVTVVVLVTVLVALFFLPVIAVTISIVYRWFMLSRYGATLGMMLAAIDLRQLDGRQPDPVVCFFHAAIFSVGMSFVVPQLISIVLMFATGHRQGLNDVILGTTMVNRWLEA
ncbi:RDD family protein [Pararhodobacter sp. SW119]|uniref:RDD family protein n=1 Tax=Pararhodobacter sp. SW119 TaxID=2780075 RepID=UPI001AE0571B|nr:RDD family protein [Pararhodobacter sp. SW119]